MRPECDRCGASPAEHAIAQIGRPGGHQTERDLLSANLCQSCFEAIADALHQKASEMLLDKGEST